MEEKVEKVEKAKEAVIKKAKIFRDMFQTPQGKKCLEFLEQEFDLEDLRGHTTEDTYYNLGRRDVVVYIRQMLKFVEKQDV